MKNSPQPSSFNFCVPHICRTTVVKTAAMHVRAEFVPRVSQASDGEGYVFSKVPDCSPHWLCPVQQQQYMTGSAHISMRTLLKEGGNGFKIICLKRDI